MRPAQLSKRAGFLFASAALAVSLVVLVVVPAPVVSIPVSHGSGDYSYPDRHLYRRAEDPSPSSKSDPLPSSTPSSPSILVSPAPRHPNKHPDHGNNNGQGIDPQAQPTNKNAFKILNPAPGDVWTSGKLETMSWEDLDLPRHVTYDISLIPEDPVSNPKALLHTRRPLLRYVVAVDRFLDMVVPYDLISKEQLLAVQESNANFTSTPIEPTPAVSNSPSPSAVTPTPTAASASASAITQTPSPSPVPCLVIRKDPEWDWREPRAQQPLQANQQPEELDAGHPEDGDILEEKDSDLAYVEDLAIEGDDHQAPEIDNILVAQEDGIMDEEQEEEENSNSDSDGDMVMDKSEDEHDHDHGGEEFMDEESEEGHEHNHGDEESMDEESEYDGHHHSHEGEESLEMVDEFEQENELNAHTPTASETGENSESSDSTGPEEDESMHEHSHTHEGDESEESEEEGDEGEGGGHHHEHSHVIDPNHFQNDDDVAIWDAHFDDLGYNPPIHIDQAGTINVTRWIDNKDRFFVGAPYVMAWSFPEEDAKLTGYVNVYIEDAETAKRYDIVAGNLPSDVQFIYLRPSALLVSAIPKKKIWFRARVELDLFWAGTIQRYTGFSKRFYVERGAL
ncbi:hypothetical protein BGX29_007310 [Mortierella sp. GBA35]|nr:hypothetical protein BGX29_007310 [Mortierella sp. GBA35]